jgi:hypothetical protein
MGWWWTRVKHSTDLQIGLRELSVIDQGRSHGAGESQLEPGFPAIGAQGAASRPSRIGEKASGMSTLRIAACQLLC